MKQAYNYAISHLSWYCELSKDIIIQEIENDLMHITKGMFSNDDFNTDFHAYLDSVSISLMWKYKTGWAGNN